MEVDLSQRTVYNRLACLVVLAYLVSIAAMPIRLLPFGIDVDFDLNRTAIAGINKLPQGTSSSTDIHLPL